MLEPLHAGLYTLVKPEVTYLIPGFTHKFRIVRIVIPFRAVARIFH